MECRSSGCERLESMLWRNRVSAYLGLGLDCRFLLVCIMLLICLIVCDMSSLYERLCVERLCGGVSIVVKKNVIGVVGGDEEGSRSDMGFCDVGGYGW